MKKLMLIAGAGLLLGASQQVHAQYRGRGGNVSLGLKAGASYTSFVGTDASGRFDYRFGFLAGGFANIGLSQLFAFQPEIIYSQKGAYDKNSTNSGVRQHYVDVPLAFHINTDGFFFEAGPQVGFLITAKNQSGVLSTANPQDYKQVDFGYLFGLGYHLKHGLGAGLRYNGSFSNFPAAIVSGNNTVQYRIRNSAFQLYATYSFN